MIFTIPEKKILYVYVDMYAYTLVVITRKKYYDCIRETIILFMTELITDTYKEKITQVKVWNKDTYVGYTREQKKCKSDL